MKRRTTTPTEQRKFAELYLFGAHQPKKLPTPKMPARFLRNSAAWWDSGWQRCHAKMFKGTAMPSHSRFMKIARRSTKACIRMSDYLDEIAKSQAGPQHKPA